METEAAIGMQAQYANPTHSDSSSFPTADDSLRSITYKTNSVANQFLATLWPVEFDALRPYLSAVELRQHDVLADFDRPIESVYFIETGGVSRTNRAHRGRPAEDVMVSHLGFVGLSAVLGSANALHRAIVIVPGLALRISAQHLNEVMQRVPSIRRHLLQYARVLVSQRQVISACNANHDLEKRLARWLLTAQDAGVSRRLPVTRVIPAQMLGASHIDVSATIRRFETRHAIVRRSHSIVVRDRAILETRVCECYRRAYEQCALPGVIHHAHSFSFMRI